MTKGWQALSIEGGAWETLNRAFSAGLAVDLERLPGRPNKRELAREIRKHLAIPLPSGAERDVVDNWLSGQIPKASRGPYSRQQILELIQRILDAWYSDAEGKRGTDHGLTDYVRCYLRPLEAEGLASQRGRAAQSPRSTAAELLFGASPPVSAVDRHKAASRTAVHGMNFGHNDEIERANKITHNRPVPLASTGQKPHGPKLTIERTADPANEPLQLTWSESRPVAEWVFDVEGIHGWGHKSSPNATDGFVCVSSPHCVYLLDSATGVLQWEMSFGKYGVRSRPTTTLDQVFVTADSHVSALDIESGTVMWAKPLAGFEGTPPTPCGGRVYVGGGRRVVAFDSETGMERWSFTTYDDVQAELLVVDGLVYVAGQDHRLWALDADTGHLLWAFEAERALFAPPVIFNGVLFLATGSWLHVLDAHSGRYLARNDVITDMVRLDGGMLYGVKKNRLLALDASTLDTKWVATVEDKQVSDLFIRSLVVDGAAAYFDTTGFAGRSNLFAIDAQAGTGRWNFLMNSLVWGGLVIGDDNLLVSSHDGVLHAIRK